LAQAGGTVQGIGEGEVAALVGFEGDGFPPAVADNVAAVIVLDGAGEQTEAGYFTVGEPGARRDEAGFAAGLLAGYASQSGWVALVGSASDDRAAAYAFGYEVGLRYACPACRLMAWSTSEVSADGLRANAIDVLLLLPEPAADSAPPAVQDVEAWVVWVEEPPVGIVPERLAGGVEFDLGPPLLEALQASLDGTSGGNWPYSAANGGIGILEGVPAAISPGRWRLVQAAWADLGSGELAISPDGAP
jgi:hypothetical protein